MNAFTDCLDALFADPNLGSAATYQAPQGAVQFPCRVVLIQPDAEFASIGAKLPARQADIRISEIALVEEGGVITLLDDAGLPIEGQQFRVQSPSQPDPQRLLWRCGLRPNP